ncbi:hypothetical protein D3C76_1037500 [compost metagenome]
MLEFLLQGAGGLNRSGVAQGVAAVEVVEDVAGRLVLELLRQRQVTLHDLVGAFQGALRPPQGGAQGDTDGNQQQGVEIGEQLQAHVRGLPTAEW